MVEDIVALGKKCTADEHADPECTKYLGTVLVDEICHEEGFAEKYGFSDCCAKVDPERYECFLDHKNSTPGFISPYQKIDKAETCKKYGENKNDILGPYLYEISIRHPKAKAVTIMKAVHGFDHVLATCCQAEDRDTCFDEKASVVRKEMMKDMAMQKHTCFLLKKFGEKPVKALKVAVLSKRFPKAEFDLITKIADDVHEECCKGDTLGCMLDRERMIRYVCTHQNEISTKLSTCCEKPLMEQADCIIHLENDEKPADLSETVREFVDNKEVCQHFAENKDQHLAKFIYEYGRRHPEFSPQLLVRCAKGYEELLENCCTHEHPETCLAKGEEQLKKHIAETLEQVKTRCEQYGQLGDYLHHNELLVLYTKKAPQLPFKELYKYTEQFNGVAAKCCKMDDAHKLTCAEEYTELVIGAICQRHIEHPINQQICRCCGGSYIRLRECFSGLGPDPEYHPAPFDPALFSFHGDYCTAKQEDQQKKKQELLVNLIKQKHDITEEQLATIVVDFGGVVTKCCGVANHEECFTEEGPKLIERIKASLGEH
ncbi:hypothetical protein ACLEE6_16665 [Lonsdalea quercina]|uniref:hypothetical protein n=1 Tax=Lonsdalea quercina TaxID=71657 RepID=UPI0039770057